MGGQEGRKLDSRGESPGGICKSVPPDGLFQPGDVAPAGVTVFQSVTPGVGNIFAPMYAELRDSFILALLGERIEEFTDLPHKRINWGMKRAGIGIPDPT